MLSNPLIAYANTYNFTTLEECAYGVIDSYLVSVSNAGYKKSAFINFFTPETDDGDAMAKLKLSEDIKALELVALNNYEVLINGVVFSTDADLKDFDQAILSICRLLKQCGFLCMPVCSECGYSVPENGASYISVIENRAFYTCDDCAEEAKQNLATKQEKKKPGSKKVGIIGALTGALLVFVLTVALYIFAFPAGGLKFGKDETDKISSLLLSLPLTALLSVLTYLFYRLFTGRKGSERILPCFIISASFTVFSVYTSTAVIYANSFNLNLNQAGRMFATIIGAPFTDPYFRTDFIRYGLYSLACVIAVTLIYSIIFDTKKAPAPLFIPVEKEVIEENCSCDACAADDNEDDFPTEQ